MRFILTILILLGSINIQAQNFIGKNYGEIIYSTIEDTSAKIQMIQIKQDNFDCLRTYIIEDDICTNYIFDYPVKYKKNVLKQMDNLAVRISKYSWVTEEFYWRLQEIEDRVVVYCRKRE